MAQSVRSRALRRGFPVYDFGGQTGQGHLQDATAPPFVAGLPTAPWTDPNQDPASVPATLAPPEDYQLGLSLWGLPGSANPDNSPKPTVPSPGTWWDPGTGRSGPMADPALLAKGEFEGTHAPVFNGYQERNAASGESGVGAVTERAQSRVEGSGSSADVEQPLTGQIRSQGGFDAVQGYGGGGPGPGGVNSVQGPTTDDQVFGGETYHGVFLNAAETDFLSPEADQFIVTAPEFPSYAPTFDVPTAAVHAQDVTGADVPAQGPAVASSLPAYATSFWG